jgi:hypothetical protein
MPIPNVALELMRYAAVAFALLFLGACAAVEQASNPRYSSLLSKADIAEIAALVAQRSDIRQPIFQITAEDPRRDRFVVYTGRQNKFGDQFDSFTVQKLRGTWRIVSDVSHDTYKPAEVIVTQLSFVRRSHECEKPDRFLKPGPQGDDGIRLPVKTET